YPDHLTNVNGTVFFSANDGVNGTELWKSDGTAGGTVMAAEILPGVESGKPRDLLSDGNVLYFAALDQTHGYELWVLADNQAPAITSAASTVFTKGAAGSFAVSATGFPNPAITEVGTLPSGVTFDTSNGVLSGTPAAGTAGTYPLTFSASNGVGSSATQSFT